jgi:hypothetical protein
VSVNDDEEDEESNKSQHSSGNQGNGFAQLLQFYADSSEDEDGFGNDDDESYNPEVPPLKNDSNSDLSLEQNLSTVHESKPVQVVDQESSSSDPSSNESDEDSKLRRAKIMLRKSKRDIQGTLQGNYDEEDDLLASNAKPRPRAIRSSRRRAVAKKKDNDFHNDFSALSEDSSSETDGKTTKDTSIDSIQDESKMEETSGEPSPPPAVRRSARAAKR